MKLSLTSTLPAAAVHMATRMELRLYCYFDNYLNPKMSITCKKTVRDIQSALDLSPVIWDVFSLLASEILATEKDVRLSVVSG